MPPIIISSPEQLAWAAGLFEAEGNIANYDGLPVVRVTNTDILLLARFRMAVGVGKIRIGNEPKLNRKRSFYYHVSGAAVRFIMGCLWPYIVTKYRRDQIVGVVGLMKDSGFMMTRVESLAWSAGVFDGEGSIGVYHLKTSDRFVDMIKIGNTQTDMLGFIKEATGIDGSIYEAKSNRLRGWQPMFYYSVSFKKARALAKLLLPYSKSTEKILWLNGLANHQVRPRGRPVE